MGDHPSTRAPPPHPAPLVQARWSWDPSQGSDDGGPPEHECSSSTLLRTFTIIAPPCKHNQPPILHA